MPFTDDTDAFADFTITDADGVNLDWATLVAIDAGAYNVTGVWQGVVGATRVLRVPLTGVAAGRHQLYLSVPNGNDLYLGMIAMTVRT